MFLQQGKHKELLKGQSFYSLKILKLKEMVPHGVHCPAHSQCRIPDSITHYRVVAKPFQYFNPSKCD